MIVYGDMVVAVNTIVDFLILQLGARLCGYPARPWRCLAAGALGGIFALLQFLPVSSSVTSFLGQFLCFFSMALIAYGVKKRAVRPAVMAFLCSAALAGSVFLLVQVFSFGAVIFRGGLYYPIGTKVLVLLAGVFYLAAAILAANVLRHGKGELYPLKLTCGDRSIRVTALLDTGNTLYDPALGRPVVILEVTRAKELLNGETALHADPIHAFSDLSKRFPKQKFSLLPYRAVGVDGGMLLAFFCQVQVGKSRPQKALAAISPNKVSDGGAYEALIGGTLL